MKKLAFTFGLGLGLGLIICTVHFRLRAYEQARDVDIQKVTNLIAEELEWSVPDFVLLSYSDRYFPKASYRFGVRNLSTGELCFIAFHENEQELIIVGVGYADE